MTSRTNPYAVPGTGIPKFIEFSNAVPDTTLEPKLKELVKIRASQINGCAVCLNMHTAAARQAASSARSRIGSRLSSCHEPASC